MNSFKANTQIVDFSHLFLFYLLCKMVKNDEYGRDLKMHIEWSFLGY